MAFLLRNPAAFAAHRNVLPGLHAPWKPSPLSVSPGRRLALRLYPRFNSTFTDPPTPPKHSRLRRIFTISLFTTAGAIVIVTSVFITIGIRGLRVPSSAQSLHIFRPSSDFIASIDEHIRTHPLAQSLRADGRYTESRPHLRMPEVMRQQSLTGNTLAGPGGIPVPPLVFHDDKRGKLVSLLYLGSEIGGHVGIVHGGLLATLMDEGLAMCGMSALPNRIAVTASLTLNYRKPVLARNYVVLKAEVVRVEGRKVWVKGTIESLEQANEEKIKKEEGGGDGMVLVEAEGLFIEPKNAKVL